MFSGDIIFCDESKFNSINGYNKIIRIVTKFQKVLDKPIYYFDTEDNSSSFYLSYDEGYSLKFEKFKYSLIFEYDGNDIKKFIELYNTLKKIVNEEVGESKK